MTVVQVLHALVMLSCISHKSEYNYMCVSQEGMSIGHTSYYCPSVEDLGGGFLGCHGTHVSSTTHVFNTY